MLGKIIGARQAPVGLAPIVSAADSVRVTSVHELIIEGLARMAARKENKHKPVQWGKRLLNAWNRGAHGISRQLQADGSYRYNVIGKLQNNLPNIK